jgi:hypothetical protein
MAAGVTGRLWSLADLVALWEIEERRAQRPAYLVNWIDKRKEPPMDESSMEEDFRRARSMDVIAIALSRFARSLQPGGQFVLEGHRWIYRPNNFVTFEVQPRKAGVLLTLCGPPAAFRERAEAFGLKDEYVNRLDRSRSSYSRYPVRNSGQLLAAAQFIKWAYDNSKPRKKSK